MITTIINNPFRVLGVFSNATIKEITANKGKITAFSKVGKAVEFPADMVSVMPPLDRNLQNIEDAISSINLPLDKLKHSLFWFANASSIDDIALKHLQAGNVEKALEIFKKRATYSSLLNTGVCSFLNNDNETAIECISILIHEDEYRNELIKTICGDTFSMSEDELSKLFIDELLTSYDASVLLGLFPTSGSDAEYLKALVIQKPIAKINSEITKAKNCGDSSDEEYNAGLLLIKNTKSALATLKKHLSSSDLQYQTTIDALARQILQCGINYFNASNDDNAVDKAMTLQQYSLNIAVSKLLKDRCQENVDTLNSLKDTYKIRKELGRLSELIKRFKDDDGDDATSALMQRLGGLSNLFGKSVSEIERFVKDSKVELVSISNKMGDNNEHYINFSDIVAIIALNKLIDTINKAQQFNSSKEALSSKLTEAMNVMSIIGGFTLKPKTRDFYNKNNATLQSIYNKLNPSGCYIATMVYGDYEHPKVLVLRGFRDEFLQKHYLGRCFIKFYYKHSPQWVEKLKDKKSINNIIRNILNAFINLYQR